MICSFSARLNRSANHVRLGLGDEGDRTAGCLQNLIFGEVVRQILGAVISASASPRGAGRGRAIQPGKPHGDRLQGGEAVPRLQTCQPTHSAFQCSTAVKIQPQPSSTVNTRTFGAPHEVRGMSDDLTVMGIAATAAAAMGRERLFSRIRRSTRLRATRMSRQTRSRAQTLRRSPRPGRAMPPGRLRSPPAAPGPRSRASVPDALDRRLLGVLAGGHGVEEERAIPRRRRPAAGLREASPCRARWTALGRRDLPPPQRPKVVRLGLQTVPPARSTRRSTIAWRYPGLVATPDLPCVA